MSADPMRAAILAAKDQMDAGMADLADRCRCNGPRWVHDLGEWRAPGAVRSDPSGYVIALYRVGMYEDFVPEAERVKLQRRWRRWNWWRGLRMRAAVLVAKDQRRRKGKQ